MTKKNKLTDNIINHTHWDREWRYSMWQTRFMLVEVMDEIRQYHRDERGKIVKVRDDLLDAIRYAYMMRRFAIPYGQRNTQESKPVMPRPIRMKGRR